MPCGKNLDSSKSVVTDVDAALGGMLGVCFISRVMRFKPPTPIPPSAIANEYRGQKFEKELKTESQCITRETPTKHYQCYFVFFN